METEDVQFMIGPYQVLKSLGQGGMGEVFLAYDTVSGRKVALKRCRSDIPLDAHRREQFLNEARITSQLTHPAIIPIYTIVEEKEQLYYTMPFIEGRMLKEIFAVAREQELAGVKPDHQSSVSALSLIFLTICRAVGYAHSKGVIHRDLKPSNIMVGPYGQVYIFDWGIASLTTQLPQKEPGKETVDKVTGTIQYIAPELAFGHPPTYQTEIYSLGLILYQMLTLRYPFHRSEMDTYRQSVEKEVLVDPAKVAPSRNVSPILSHITLKCLAPSLEARYQTVDEVIHDLEIYLEGRPGWLKIADLDIQDTTYWESVSGTSLRVSKEPFPDTFKLEAKVRIGENGQGIGFLLNLPEAAQLTDLNKGHSVWLAPDLNPPAEQGQFPIQSFLQRDVWYQVRIERSKKSLHFYLNDLLQFSYVNYLPERDTHVGLLYSDADFAILDFSLFLGHESFKVNHLQVADAFLAHKEYIVALREYRLISKRFPETMEDREALFYAGITLLEEANDCHDPVMSRQKGDEAIEEFSKLQGTAGSPLAYVGKTLVAHSRKDYEEEAAYFEMAYRRYPHHFLLPQLQELLIYRVQESFQIEREACYRFSLLAIRYLPLEAITPPIQKLFTTLQQGNDQEVGAYTEPLQRLAFAIRLAFWLAKPIVLAEIIDEVLAMAPAHLPTIENALFALIELGAWEVAQEKLDKIFQRLLDVQAIAHLELIQKAILVHQRDLRDKR